MCVISLSLTGLRREKWKLGGVRQRTWSEISPPSRYKDHYFASFEIWSWELYRLRVLARASARRSRARTKFGPTRNVRPQECVGQNAILKDFLGLKSHWSAGTDRLVKRPTSLVNSLFQSNLQVIRNVIIESLRDRRSVWTYSQQQLSTGTSSCQVKQAALK